ncbi:ATP-binding protein, partial [Streptomyces sp. DSM 44917]
MATPAIAPRSTRATPAPRPQIDDAALAFRLPALDRSVRVARARTREALAGWGLSAPAVENAELVVSELVTNAVLHTGSQAVVCTLRAGEGLVRVEVADQRTTAPHPPGGSARARAARAEDERGRGLILVEALSTAWGVSPGPDGRGRRG